MDKTKIIPNLIRSAQYFLGKVFGRKLNEAPTVASVDGSVRRELNKVFSSQDVEIAVAMLLNSKFPMVVGAVLTRRIHHAIIYLSGKSLVKLKEAIELAKIDWRDVLVSAGLGNSNWEEVLKSRGIFSNIITQAIQEHLNKLFKEDAIKASLILERSRFVRVVSEVEWERIHFALLILSGGKLDYLSKALDSANIDWRGTLTSANLAHENWREALEKKGFDTSRLLPPKTGKTTRNGNKC